jgi:hypothetical protein
MSSRMLIAESEFLGAGPYLFDVFVNESGQVKENQSSQNGDSEDYTLRAVDSEYG